MSDKVQLRGTAYLDVGQPFQRSAEAQGYRHRIGKVAAVACDYRWACGKAVARMIEQHQLAEGSDLRCLAYLLARHDDAGLYVEFTDGTGLLVITSHTGPYSPDTPDVAISIHLYAVTFGA